MSGNFRQYHRQRLAAELKQSIFPTDKIIRIRRSNIHRVARQSQHMVRLQNFLFRFIIRLNLDQSFNQDNRLSQLIVISHHIKSSTQCPHTHFRSFYKKRPFGIFGNLDVNFAIDIYFSFILLKSCRKTKRRARIDPNLRTVFQYQMRSSATLRHDQFIIFDLTIVYIYCISFVLLVYRRNSRLAASIQHIVPLFKRNRPFPGNDQSGIFLKIRSVLLYRRYLIIGSKRSKKRINTYRK